MVNVRTRGLEFEKDEKVCFDSNELHILEACVRMLLL
jgi:hypothetical protein